MHKFEFTLKQHTPLIHFQHHQDGATLRASEVKPRLDRFIITELGDGDYSKGLRKAKANKWLIGDGEHGALDYRMRIVVKEYNMLKVDFDYKSINNSSKFRPDFPNIFGNVHVHEKKGFSFYNEILLQIFINNEDLSRKIKNHLDDFFHLNNFGFRSSKGFGSFSVNDYNPTNIRGEYQFKLENNSNDFKNLFNAIDLFGRCLKSGLNIKKRENGYPYDKLYFKSLLFKYACDLNPAEQWDKRTIRDTLFQNHLKYKKNSDNTGIYYSRTETNGTVHFSSKKPKNRNYYDFRDLLGLSTQQEWLYYCKTVNKKISFQKDGKNYNIERFQSPITYKPYFIKNEKKSEWHVYIIPNEIPKEYLGAEVVVDGNDKEVTLNIYPHFKVNDYLKFAIEEFDHTNATVGKIVIDNNVKEIKLLEDIFSQLKKQINQ